MILAGCIINDVDPDPGQSRGRRRKFPLILVVDLHRLPQHRYPFGARHPGEGRRRQQLIIPSQGSQVMTISITMPLREQRLRVCRVQHPVRIHTA